MDWGLIATIVGICVAGLAGVLGVWMERDRNAPPKWAWVFSGLIVIATGVELSHSVVQASEDAATEEAMARVLGKLAVISAKSHNFDANGDETEFDYYRLMKIILGAGFRDIVAIEYEGKVTPPVEGVLATKRLIEKAVAAV